MSIPTQSTIRNVFSRMADLKSQSSCPQSALFPLLPYPQSKSTAQDHPLFLLLILSFYQFADAEACPPYLPLLPKTDRSSSPVPLPKMDPYCFDRTHPRRSDAGLWPHHKSVCIQQLPFQIYPSIWQSMYPDEALPLTVFQVQNPAIYPLNDIPRSIDRYRPARYAFY